MNLPEKPILKDFQDLMRALVIERGFEKETISEVFMLLSEEVGELAKALRKGTGLKTSDHSKKHDIEEELADVFWMVIDRCNRLNVDLEKVFREKEAKNQTRAWK